MAIYKNIDKQLPQVEKSADVEEHAEEEPAKSPADFFIEEDDPPVKPKGNPSKPPMYDIE